MIEFLTTLCVSVGILFALYALKYAFVKSGIALLLDRRSMEISRCIFYCCILFILFSIFYCYAYGKGDLLQICLNITSPILVVSGFYFFAFSAIKELEEPYDKNNH